MRLTRPEFLIGLGAALASYGGARLLPNQHRNALIAWGRENGIIRPVWQGWQEVNWNTYAQTVEFCSLLPLQAEISLTVDARIADRIAKFAVPGSQTYLIFDPPYPSNRLRARFCGSVQQLGKTTLYFTGWGQ